MRWAWVLVLGLGVLGLGSYVGTEELFSLGLDAWDAGMAGTGLALASGPGALLANPAGLAGETGLQLSSTFGSTFGQASASTAAVSLAWLGVGGVRLSLPPDGGTPFLQEGALLGVGIPISPDFSIGARGRLLHLVYPEEHTGWALDLAALYRGPVSAALVAGGALAKAPTPGRSGPPPCPWDSLSSFLWGISSPATWPLPPPGSGRMPLPSGWGPSCGWGSWGCGAGYPRSLRPLGCPPAGGISGLTWR